MTTMMTMSSTTTTTQRGSIHEAGVYYHLLHPNTAPTCTTPPTASVPSQARTHRLVCHPHGVCNCDGGVLCILRRITDYVLRMYGVYVCVCVHLCPSPTTKGTVHAGCHSHQDDKSSRSDTDSVTRRHVGTAHMCVVVSTSEKNGCSSAFFAEMRSDGLYRSMRWGWGKGDGQS